jgi:hypothetical protein
MKNRAITAFFLFITISLLPGCSKSITEAFRETQPGQAMYSCVTSDGDLTISSINKDVVDAHLIKNGKDAHLQFSIKPDIGQAKLVGASIEGEEKLTQFSLMINLELMCGGQLSAQMLPDAYNNLRMMNSLSNIFR